MPRIEKKIEYLDRAQYILDCLDRGLDRKKLAFELGYTNPKSLDIFMRRKGFYYEPSKGNYLPLQSDQITGSNTFTEGKRISNILALFSKEEADPKQIAELTGFKNHLELADYMKAHNFAWNDKVGNYTKMHGLEITEIPLENGELFNITDFYTYLPLLRKLHDHKDALLQILEGHQTEINKDNVQINLNPATIELLNNYSQKHSIPITHLIESAILKYLTDH